MKKALTQNDEYATQSTMPAGQLEKLARFLEVHPRFYPGAGGGERNDLRLQFGRVLPQRR
jgi:hypothetical protein